MKNSSKIILRLLTLFFGILLCSTCKKDPIIQYDLKVSVLPNEGGTVSPLTGSYKDGESASITATPSTEFIFTGWSGDASGSVNPLTLTMTADKNITANFEKRKYPLSLTIDGSGTIKEEIVQTKSANIDYPSGTLVKLTAIPNTGYEFISWSGDYQGSDNPAVITIDKAKSITVKFKVKYNVLTSRVKIEIPGVNNKQIQSAAYNVSGMTYFVTNGQEYILLSGSYNGDEIGPLIQLKKDNGLWKYYTCYSNVSMGMARNYEFADNGNSLVYADHGQEYGDPWPFGHLYFGRLQSGNISWVQVSKYKSFYHSVSSGDINNDGLTDVVGLHMGTRSDWTSDNLHTYTQNSDGSFDENRNLISTLNWIGNHGAGAVLVKNLFGDSTPEIIRADYGFNSNYQQPSDRYSIAIFFFNKETGKYEIVKNPGAVGVFSNPDRGATSIKAFDFDKDGDLDLAIAVEGQDFNGIEIWKQDGQGNFVPTNQRLEFNFNEMQFREFEVFDVDKDGYEDIILNPFHYGNLFRIEPVWWNPDLSKGILLHNFIWKNKMGVFELYKDKDLTIPNINPDYCKAFNINGEIKFICIRSGSWTSNEVTVSEIMVDFK